MAAYYNEFKPEAAHMLRQLICDGIIADGEVDERSITEVTANDIKGFTQCHFFAGIGGWSVALRSAGWADDRPVWTGSCPCQPFSTAGKQKGKEDERHLWPIWSKLIAEIKPSTIFGEQVSSAISHGWLDGVYADLEAEGYTLGAAVLPACSVNAPHKRDRLWFVGNSPSAICERDARGLLETERRERSTREQDGNLHQRLEHAGQGRACGVGQTASAGFPERGGCAISQSGTQQESERCGEAREYISRPTERSIWAGDECAGNVADSECQRLQGQGPMGESLYSAQGENGQTDRAFNDSTGFWFDYEWLLCGDGKIRRVPTTESGICIVAHGIQHRTPLLHAFGNAIVPEVASRFIQAVM